MKAYKGFNKDMTCRGFQYEEGETYETEEASLCNSGFHACENPIDCFGYYPPGTSEYHEVELEEVSGNRQHLQAVTGQHLQAVTCQHLQAVTCQHLQAVTGQ